MKQKFKLRTKIGQRVTKIEIGIRAECDKHKDTLLYRDGVTIKDYKIVYQSKHKTAINSSYISTFDRQEVGDNNKLYCNDYLEKSIISIKTKETYFANGIFGTIYTLGDSEKAIKKLTNDMQKKVNKEYGFMFNIDIADVVDGYLNSK